MSDVRRSLTMSVEMVKRLLPEFDQVSIAVVDGVGNLSTLAQVGDLAIDLDQLQHDLGEGPCLDSLRTAAPVVVPHIQGDERWPRFVAEAAELRLASQIATPLQWRNDKPLGALNLYSTTRDEIAPTASPIAEAFAAQVAGAVVSFREVETLHRALATRKTIGVAIGIIMAQFQLNETAAMAVLRRQSSWANVKLRDVAAQVAAEGKADGLDFASRLCGPARSQVARRRFT